MILSQIIVCSKCSCSFCRPDPANLLANWSAIYTHAEQMTRPLKKAATSHAANWSSVLEWTMLMNSWTQWTRAGGRVGENVKRTYNCRLILLTFNFNNSISVRCFVIKIIVRGLYDYQSWRSLAGRHLNTDLYQSSKKIYISLRLNSYI